MAWTRAGPAWSIASEPESKRLEQIYGAHVFEYLKQHPAEGQIFNDAMTELSMIDSPAVAEAYNFEGIRTIVDIAGGHGLLLPRS